MFHLTRLALGAITAIVLTLAAAGGGLPVGAHPLGAQNGHLAVSPSLPGLHIGKMHALSEHSWLAYYDGHKDTYINTDVSSKSQATSLKINFAPILSHSLGASSPMYFVKGRAAAGQIAVFGSEPGESDYSPLWREFWVTWKSGATPVLLVKDDQINALVKAGKLTEQTTRIILNAPVTSVGH
jgi:hypothetical protein